MLTGAQEVEKVFVAIHCKVLSLQQTFGMIKYIIIISMASKKLRG